MAQVNFRMSEERLAFIDRAGGDPGCHADRIRAAVERGGGD